MQPGVAGVTKQVLSRARLPMLVVFPNSEKHARNKEGPFTSVMTLHGFAYGFAPGNGAAKVTNNMLSPMRPAGWKIRVACLQTRVLHLTGGEWKAVTATDWAATTQQPKLRMVAVHYTEEHTRTFCFEDCKIAGRGTASHAAAAARTWLTIVLGEMNVFVLDDLLCFGIWKSILCACRCRHACQRLRERAHTRSVARHR